MANQEENNYQFAPVTVHDAKAELITFFKVENNRRVNAGYLKRLTEQKKALMLYNKKIREKRRELENNILAGRNVKESDDLLTLKKKTELDVPLRVRDLLSEQFYIFKFNEFYLREINYFELNNKVNFFSGKDYYFILNTSFKKYKITRNKVIKMTNLSEENFALFLIEKYEEGFEAQKKEDKGEYTGSALKRRNKMYEKISMVIAHNKAIALDDSYEEELYKVNDKGEMVKKEGKYPMFFELNDEVMNVYIMRTRYFHSRFYNREIERLKNRSQNFEVVKTTYTKKLVYGPMRMIFNNEGDIDNNTLSLIGAVRKDAKNYIAKTSYEQINENNIKRGKIHFFNMLNLIDDEDVVVKVDIKSAYWEYAMYKTIITEETNEKFKKLFEGYETKVAKRARLKALGSLATTRIYQKYEKGKLIDEEVKTEPTKGLYMSICAGIDDLMNDLAKNVDGCLYYYWDCIFIKKKFENEAIEYLRNQGYSSTSQETSLQYMKFGNTGYIFSIKDNKTYMVRKENQHLIDAEYGKKEDRYEEIL